MKANKESFRKIEKFCPCGKKLKLNNNRDIKRKNYCSQKCMGYYIGKKRFKEFYQLFARKSNCEKTNKKKSHKGKNHPKWIKDRTKLKSKRMSTSPEVKTWRLSVFARDNFTCVICNKVGGKLNAHHILSWENYPNRRFDINNGITMCYSCHKEFHRKNIVRKVG